MPKLPLKIETASVMATEPDILSFDANRQIRMRIWGIDSKYGSEKT
jgi:hypothetical protein